MLLVHNNCLDPAFNLALEEYLLTSFEEEVLCLWRNRRAIVVGKNQNTVAELDPEFVREHNIAVVRRLTGGGAVFHDPGNINYTLIRSCGKDDFNNYAKFTAPILNYLASLGIRAELSGRNDLVIDSMKCSGSAQTVRAGRILHHGCLLFSADLSQLAGALRPRPVKLQSNGVASVRSRVTNIADHLSEPISPEEFLKGLEQFLYQSFPDVVAYELTPEDITAVQQLVKTRYGTWEWNFGSSPRYSLSREEKYPFGLVEASLSVKDGLITELSLHGDFFGMKDIIELQEALIGLPHQYEALMQKLTETGVSDYISGMSPQQLATFLC